MELPINIVNDIINYLSRQPWREVDSMIKGIIQAQAQEKSAIETKEKELPLVRYLQIIKHSFTNPAIVVG